MKLINIKVVAFDCDGVMFDTTKSNMTYYNRILEHFNMPHMTADQFAYTHMHTVNASLDYLFENKEIRKKADEVRKTLNYFSLIRYMEIEPGLKPLLEKLRPEYKTAIATNRSDTMDRVLLEHNLEGYFDIVISARDVDRPKPFPDPLLKIMNHFKISSDNIVYIGDSEVDEQASLAAGIPFIAYNNPSLTADIHIKSLSEIESLL
ncbi:MAG: HAD-IA family hydrolase [Deltaproteobacteria bacterium]|nr:HAD-IA family hydrolase [Deltaproteobacteria bacterium]